MAEASIAHEFYKLRNEWKKIDGKKWQCMIWVLQYQDLDIVDKFMEIERSPIGIFDDIFFRFDVSFTNKKSFEENLWKEYISWFERPEEEKYDMLKALENDGFLKESYAPDQQVSMTAENLFSEFGRFRKALGIKDNFIIYFPIDTQSGYGFKDWVQEKLKIGLPEGLRFALVDIENKRTLPLARRIENSIVVELFPELDMIAATKNEINKEGNNFKPNDPSTQFGKQLRKVLEVSTSKKISLLEKESERLIDIAHQLNTGNFLLLAYLSVGNSYYMIDSKKRGLAYIDKAIVEAEKLMGIGSSDGYPSWRSAILLKAALLIGMEDESQAIEIYKKMIDKATEEGDVYFIMDGYRLLAFTEYKQRQFVKAWDYALLSLQAGAYLPLDVRRQSTYLISAELVDQMAKDRSSRHKEILYNQLEEWIGKDWRSLLKGKDLMSQEYLQSEININS